MNDGKTERWRDRGKESIEMEKQIGNEIERQRNGEIERRKVRETERQKDRETDRVEMGKTSI